MKYLISALLLIAAISSKAQFLDDRIFVFIDSVQYEWASNVDTVDFGPAPFVWYEIVFRSDGKGKQRIDRYPVGDTIKLQERIIVPIYNKSVQIAENYRIIKQGESFYRELKARDNKLKSLGLPGLFKILDANFTQLFTDTLNNNYRIVAAGTPYNDADITMNANGVHRLKWNSSAVNPDDRKNIVVRMLAPDILVLVDYPAEGQELFLYKNNVEKTRWESYGETFILRKQ